jgi:hypothetical protein
MLTYTNATGFSHPQQTLQSSGAQAIALMRTCLQLDDRTSDTDAPFEPASPCVVVLYQSHVHGLDHTVQRGR